MSSKTAKRIRKLFRRVSFPASTEDIKTFARHEGIGAEINAVEQLNPKVYQTRTDLLRDLNSRE